MALMVKLQRPVLPTATSDQIDLKLEGVDIGDCEPPIRTSERRDTNDGGGAFRAADAA